MRTLILGICLSVMAAACGSAPATDLCSNEADGYRVTVPAELEVDDTCSVFDEDLSTIPAGTDAVVPTAFATTVDLSAAAVLDRTQQRSTTAVTEVTPIRFGESTGWRIEATQLDDTLLPRGARTYRYVLPLGTDQSIVLSTVESPEVDYDVNRALLDEIAAGVEPLEVNDELVANQEAR